MIFGIIAAIAASTVLDAVVLSGATAATTAVIYKAVDKAFDND